MPERLRFCCVACALCVEWIGGFREGNSVCLCVLCGETMGQERVWAGAGEKGRAGLRGDIPAEGFDVGFVLFSSGGFLVPDVLVFADEVDGDVAIVAGDAVGVGLLP